MKKDRRKQSKKQREKIRVTINASKQWFRCYFFVVRHGRALAGESPEHAQVVGNV